MTQWFFKTTAYADELREFELPPGGEWPERTKTIQRNWIGRSEGAEIIFRIEELDLDVAVFTTRPDTLYGATFFVVAPEHPLVEQIGGDEVLEYARHAGVRKAEERETETVKTGVFTGHHVVNPVNGERLPIYVADYVLMDYGTGAIMAVPAHDERDHEFAQTFDLAERIVIDDDGVLVDSGEFTGMPAEDAKAAIVAWLRKEGRGAPAVSYRLRDWSFRVSATGALRSRSSTATTAEPFLFPTMSSVAAPRRGRLSAEGEGAACFERGVAARGLSAVRQARYA